VAVAAWWVGGGVCRHDRRQCTQASGNFRSMCSSLRAECTWGIVLRLIYDDRSWAAVGKRHPYWAHLTYDGPDGAILDKGYLR
jgi:hypothetical protein